MRIKQVVAVLFVHLAMAVSLFAAIDRVDLRVEGMTWNFWAYGVQQHLQRLDGVAKAEVSLRDGHVTITPKPDASLDPYLILKATYDSGVTVAEMAITVSGEIVQTGGALALHVNARQSFEISPGAIAEQLKSAATRGDASAAPRVTVKGILYRKPPGKGKPKMPTTGLKLEITESNDVR